MIWLWEFVDWNGVIYGKGSGSTVSISKIGKEGDAEEVVQHSISNHSRMGNVAFIHCRTNGLGVNSCVSANRYSIP